LFRKLHFIASGGASSGAAAMLEQLNAVVVSILSIYLFNNQLFLFIIKKESASIRDVTLLQETYQHSLRHRLNSKQTVIMDLIIADLQ
jgi:hypothetical protein